MAEESPRRPAPPVGRPGAAPPTPAGWRVTPAPDGRAGGKPAGQPNRPNPRWLVGLLVLGLLALNLWISSQALKPNSRVRIPYSPTFLAQVQSRNVSEISSTGDAIQGSFRNQVNYPQNDPNARPTSNFSTQVPSFANNTELSNLLQSNGVTIDAKPPDTGPSFLRASSSVSGRRWS